MRFASIREMDVTNGEGIGIALFVQGCPFHCHNCFNKETWDFDGGKEWNDSVKEHFINLANKEYISRISILGGEPLSLHNIYEVINITKELKERYPNKKIWLYSGYTYEQILDEFPEALDYVDVLVDGMFIDELKDFNLEFRGSSNQRIIRFDKK